MRTHSFGHALTLTHSPTYSLIRPRTQSLTHSLTHSFAHALTRPRTHSLTHSFAHSLTHPPTHSLTHSLTHVPLYTRKVRMRRRWEDMGFVFLLRPPLPPTLVS